MEGEKTHQILVVLIDTREEWAVGEIKQKLEVRCSHKEEFMLDLRDFVAKVQMRLLRPNGPLHTATKVPSATDVIPNFNNTCLIVLRRLLRVITTASRSRYLERDVRFEE